MTARSNEVTSAGLALGFGLALGAALPHPLLMILGAMICVGFTLMRIARPPSEEDKG